MGHFRYGRDDQTVTAFDKATLVAGLMAGLTQLAGVSVHHSSDRDGVKYIMDDNSWLLIRPSGTEPVLRVYAEASNEQQVQALLAEGGKLAEKVLTKMQKNA